MGDEQPVPAPGWYRRTTSPGLVTYFDGRAFVESMSGPLPPSFEEIPVHTGAPGGQYWEVAKLEVRVASPRVGVQPTVADANRRLQRMAAELGANAVLDATYRRGTAPASWRSMRAEGRAVVFAQTPPPPAASAPEETEDRPDVASRLRTLEDLRRSGLITEAEYDQRRQRILDSI